MNNLFKTSKPLTMPLERVKRPFELLSDAELIASAGKTLIFDIEVYPNYFLIVFKEIESGKYLYFEQSPDSALDVNKLMWCMRSFRLVGFNSARYDMVMAWLAINGHSTQLVKQASDKLIIEGYSQEDIEKEYGFKSLVVNHIDLIDVAPLKASLKAYAGRLHCERLQDLPFNPNTFLTRSEAEVVRHYCFNDTDNTELLFKKLSPQIKLREELGTLYGLDLRSSSDANIAEQVLSHEITKINGYRPKRPKIEPGTTYKYEAPKYLTYQTPVLQNMLQQVRNADLIVTERGNIELPSEMNGLEITIGRSVYRMGIGGLHSSEKQVAHKADENTLLIDRDVASYYPSIILSLGLYPKQTGKTFLKVYRDIVEKRLKAKHEGDKVTADSLKITINGTFGKAGNKYSCVYSPHMMVTVTLTGQLALLLLIERIELAGIPVVSGNTDGIVIKCPKSRYDDLNAIISMWEHETGFETEETRYKALYSRDVNNYLAYKENGTFKGKGVYGEPSLSKNPANLICIEAVKQMLLNNTPVEETIKSCKDIRNFVTVRNVKGGAEKDGYYLGKVVRWYYAKNIDGEMRYIISGNKVPRTEGAKPLMDLPDKFPNDVNYKWYVEETEEILREIGFYGSRKAFHQLTFF